MSVRNSPDQQSNTQVIMPVNANARGAAPTLAKTVKNNNPLVVIPNKRPIWARRHTNNMWSGSQLIYKIFKSIIVKFVKHTRIC